MVVSTPESTSGSLYAEVIEKLKIYEDGQNRVDLKVKSTNLSKQTIVLDKNYRIPVKHATHVEAKDHNDDDLIAYHDKKRGRIEIVFKPGTVLPPGQTITWSVSYVTPEFGKQTGEDKFCAHFSINPQKQYKGINIENHKFDLRVTFQKPETGRKYKEISVEQDNTLKIRVKKETKPDGIECQFEPFNLGRGNELKITFMYEYVRASSLSPIWGAVSPTLLGVWGFVSPILSTALKEFIVSIFTKK